MGDRAGDNSQILGLGEALGWPFEIKHFVYTRFEKLVNLPFMKTLAGVSKAESSALNPPWPDLIITAGRRNEPIARCIREQSPNHVRIVHVGRPWARIEHFDLVVTTPQYRLPDLPNVLHNETPLHRVNLERLAKAAAEWAPRLEDLPKPRIAVLLGGNSGPYPFDVASGERLAAQANLMAKETGGSLMVTTSKRTPADTTDALEAALTCPNVFYRFSPDATENPYFGFLGLADAVIVTADSVSMMAEACSAEKPVYFYDTGRGETAMHRPAGSEATSSDSRGLPLSRQHLKALTYRLTMLVGPERLTRDIRIVQQLLIDTGRAGWLGEGPAPPNPPPLLDMERAAERVQALF